MNFHKTGMYFVNVICSILSICLLFTSFILDRKIHYVDKIINETPIKVTSLILYILGCSYLFLIFSVGCIGTSSENGGLLFTYSFTILFLVLIQVSLACFSVFHVDHMTNGAAMELKNHYIAQRYSNASNSAEIFREAEIRLVCCGLTGPRDYGGYVIPRSCCSSNIGKTDVISYCENKSIHKTGCLKALILYLHDIIEITTVVCLVNGVLFIVAALYIGFFAEKLKLEERIIERPRQFPIV